MIINKRIKPEFIGVVEDVYKEAKANKIKIHLKNTKTVKLPGETNKCKGYFITEPTPLLVVAVGDIFEKWIETFLHEASHMEQFIEDPLNFEGDDIWNWLEGKEELSKELIDKYILSYINLELDCEKRVIQKISKYNLPINIEEYIQKANTYLYFYEVIVRKRKWITGVYQNPKIWKLAPKTFKKDYSKVPKKLREVLEELIK